MYVFIYLFIYITFFWDAIPDFYSENGGRSFFRNFGIYLHGAHPRSP
jgi:hypothetical protein